MGVSEGLFAEEEARHPMWVPPHPSEALTAQVRALRKEIARQLRRFDGRKDMIVPVAFCQAAYEASLMPQATRSAPWLIGEVTLRGALTGQMLDRSKKETNKRERQKDARDTAITQDLVKKFTEAIIKEVLS